jgi:hypothetical protein
LICLRNSNLAAMAKLQLSSDRSPCLLQIHYSVVRLRGAGTIDSAFPRCLSKFALLYPQYCSTSRAELVIIPTISPPDRP